MNNFFTRSLRTRLVTILILTALIPVAITGILSYVLSRQALQKTEMNSLITINEYKKDIVISYLEGKFSMLRVLASRDIAMTACQKLQAYDESGEGTPTGTMDVNSDEYKKIYNEIDPNIRKFRDEYELRDVFLISSDSGHVLYTVAKEADLGENLSVGKLKDSGLARLWKKVLEEKKEVMVDYSYYEPSGIHAIFLGGPLFDENNNVIAVVAIQINTNDFLSKIIIQRAALGESGETVIVGEDYLMRSDSRFSETSDILIQKVDSIAIKNALEGKSGVVMDKDYRGVDSLISYANLDLKNMFGADFNWAIITKIDQAEAFSSVKILGLNIIWISIGIFLLVALVGWFLARGISNPIRKISTIMVKIGEGDLTVKTPPDKRVDEIGKLNQTLHIMVENLKTQIKEILEGVNTLFSFSPNLVKEN